MEFRPVRQTDIRLLFDWANEPSVRINSYNSRPIKWEEHVVWFNSQLTDNDCKIFILLTSEGEPAGQIRLNKEPSGTAVIGVSIDIHFRGRGYATDGLKTVCREVTDKGWTKCILAYIKVENDSSIATFEKAGFFYRKRIEIKGCPSKEYSYLPHRPSRLVLGTVQLGIKYGIANEAGKPDRATAFKILETALSGGIDTVDTARAYGESESIIGEFNHAHGAPLKIITKIPSLPSDLDPKKVRDYCFRTFEESLKALKTDKILGLMFHNADDYSNHKDAIISFLENIRKDRMSARTGISFYDPSRIFQYMDDPLIDIIQAPFNLFDKRILKNGLPEKLDTAGKVICLRSIYLQGLFLVDRENVAKIMPEAVKLHEKLSHLTTQFALSMIQAAFLFVRDMLPFGNIVFGAEKIEQVEENLEMLRLPELTPEASREFNEAFNEISEPIINPSQWKQN